MLRPTGWWGVLQQWRYYLSCHGINKHTKTSRKRSEQIGRTQQLSHTLFRSCCHTYDTLALKEPRLGSFLCHTSNAEFLVLVEVTNSYYRSVSVRSRFLIHSFIYRCKCKKDIFYVAFEKKHVQVSMLSK